MRKKEVSERVKHVVKGAWVYAVNYDDAIATLVISDLMTLKMKSLRYRPHVDVTAAATAEAAPVLFHCGAMAPKFQRKKLDAWRIWKLFCQL